MLSDASLFELLQQGGLTTLLLLVLSVGSLALAVVKALALRGVSETTADRLAETVLRRVREGDVRGALAATEDAPGGDRRQTPLGAAFRAMFESPLDPGEALQQVGLARLDRETVRIEAGLGVLATLGAVAPFIGLFGTVVGVIRAFDALGTAPQAGGGGFAPVMTGIAEALVATAAGLLVAVPAVILYNYFSRRIRRYASVAEAAIIELDATLVGGPTRASVATSTPAPARHAPLAY